jgi:hypothetical protein
MFSNALKLRASNPENTGILEHVIDIVNMFRTLFWR